MDDPNEYQVGGSHYRKGDYQTWDLLILIGAGYLEGNAIKYVVRWRKKGGIDDLKKSLHYVNKLEEASPIRYADPHNIFPAEISKFAKSNGLNDIEHSFVLTVALWDDHTDLEGARQLLFLLMDEAENVDAAEIPDRRACSCS